MLLVSLLFFSDDSSSCTLISLASFCASQIHHVGHMYDIVLARPHFLAPLAGLALAWVTFAASATCSCSCSGPAVSSAPSCSSLLTISFSLSSLLNKVYYIPVHACPPCQHLLCLVIFLSSCWVRSLLQFVFLFLVLLLWPTVCSFAFFGSAFRCAFLPELYVLMKRGLVLVYVHRLIMFLVWFGHLRVGHVRARCLGDVKATAGLKRSTGELIKRLVVIWR